MRKTRDDGKSGEKAKIFSTRRAEKNAAYVVENAHRPDPFLDTRNDTPQGAWRTASG
jgi:hypothetical protein